MIFTDMRMIFIHLFHTPRSMMLNNYIKDSADNQINRIIKGMNTLNNIASKLNVHFHIW